MSKTKIEELPNLEEFCDFKNYLPSFKLYLYIMKNFKKIMSILLAIAIVVGVFSTMSSMLRLPFFPRSFVPTIKKTFFMFIFPLISLTNHLLKNSAGENFVKLLNIYDAFSFNLGLSIHSTNILFHYHTTYISVYYYLLLKQK